MKVMLAVLYLTVGVHGIPLPEGSTIPCVNEPLSRLATLEGLEQLVYSIASEKDVQPTVILNRLLRKVRAKQRMMRNRNPLQQIAMQELLNTLVEIPPLSAGKGNGSPTPPNSKPAPRPIRPEPPTTPNSGLPPESARIFIPPMPFRPPITEMMKRQDCYRVVQRICIEEEFHKRVEVFKRSSTDSNNLPTFLREPGVTVKVNPGGVEAALPDVTVTISPMMTVVEALRQADAKFQRALGLSSHVDVIAFSHNPYAGCYVISRFDNVHMTRQLVWKMAVTDRDGNIIYNDICLPRGKEVPVKPGTTISLSYTAL